MSAHFARMFAKPNKENEVRARRFELFAQSVIEVLKGDKKKVRERREKKVAMTTTTTMFQCDAVRNAKCVPEC